MFSVLLQWYLSMPFFIRARVSEIAFAILNTIYRNRIIRACDKDFANQEKGQIADYLRRNCFTGSFLYDYIKEYDETSIPVYRDDDGYPYVLHKGKRLYGKRGWDKSEFRHYYNGLLIEQDYRSPHCYLVSQNRIPQKGTILADIGAAEGIFTLDIIEFVDYAYLFECDDEWMIPLQKTFKPWENKIQIIDRMVGDNTNGKMITLDSFFEGKNLTYVKADIEGAEELMLQGAADLFSDSVKQALLCAYHRDDAENVILNYLNEHSMKTEINKGYILFFDSFILRPPFLRRGVIYASRTNG